MTKSLFKGDKLKFIYFEKATKFFEIFTLLLSHVVPVKSKVKISQNFVAFSEYMTFITWPGSHMSNFFDEWEVDTKKNSGWKLIYLVVFKIHT